MNILALAVSPVAILLFWVYHKDRYEKEPLGLIFLILVFGALACIPAAIMELAVEPFLIHENSSILGLFVYTTLGIGLVEEGCKFIMLKQVTWRNRHFSQRFDGIVYAVSASLGFALLENLLYVFSGGVTVGILRALTAVPMHTAFGIIMGLYYGRARFDATTNPVWTIDPSDGSLSEPRMVQGSAKRANTNMLKALVIPTLLHGLYDFAAMAISKNAWYTVLLVVVLAATSIYAVKLVLRESKLP